MQRKPNAALLGAFWFGIQMVWGALLGISLQARTLQVAPEWTLAAYSVLATSGACVAAVTQIAAGIVSDRLRRRGSRRLEFYTAGALAGAAAVMWFYAAPSFTQLLAALLLVQFALNVAIGPYQAAIPDFVENAALGGASAWMAALQNLGNVAGAIAASFIRSAWETGASIAAGLLFTCGITSAHVRELTAQSPVEMRLRITRVFGDLFVSRALMYLGFYTLLGYLYFYVARIEHAGVKERTGMLLIVFLLAGAAGAAAAGRARRLDRRVVAGAGGCVFIAALVGFLFAPAFGELAGAAGIAGFGWGIFLTADWALGCAFLPRGALATAMGIWNLALLVPQILAPLAVTAVLAWMHALADPNAPRIAFVVACLEVAAGIGWLGRLPGCPPLDA
jgi:MFS family permease